MANGRSPRVNMTVTVPLRLKARLRAYAEAQNNHASRIAENAIRALLGPWGTDKDETEEAAAHREAVARHLEIEEGRHTSS